MATSVEYDSERRLVMYVSDVPPRVAAALFEGTTGKMKRDANEFLIEMLERGLGLR